jgi:hypothetical protein
MCLTIARKSRPHKGDARPKATDCATPGGLFGDGTDDPDTPENEDGIEVADVIDAIKAARAMLS